MPTNIEHYPSTTYPSTTAPPGWQCGCGAWVPNGITHTCWTRPATATPFLPPRLSDEDVDRIARRVVELLDQRK